MENKTNTVLIVLLTIFIMLTMGLSGYIIYDKILKEDTEQQTNEPANNENEEKQDAVSYCIENIDSIYNKIIKLQNESFTATYFPEDLVLFSKENINCDSSIYQNENELYIFEGESGFIYNISEDELLRDISESRFDTEYQLQAFNYAKQLISQDKDNYYKKHPEFNLGTFYDKNYINGDIYVLRICEYEDEGSDCPKHYYDYEINFKERTYKKVNVDIE